MTSFDFWIALRDYCGKLGASVTSYGRTVQRNSKVGGVEASKHLVWQAADVVYDVMPSEELRRKTAEQLAIRLVIEADHDHLQTL